MIGILCIKFIVEKNLCPSTKPAGRRSDLGERIGDDVRFDAREPTLVGCNTRTRYGVSITLQSSVVKMTGVQKYTATRRFITHWVGLGGWFWNVLTEESLSDVRARQEPSIGVAFFNKRLGRKSLKSGQRPLIAIWIHEYSLGATCGIKRDCICRGFWCGIHPHTTLELERLFSSNKLVLTHAAMHTHAQNCAKQEKTRENPCHVSLPG